MPLKEFSLAETVRNGQSIQIAEIKIAPVWRLFYMRSLFLDIVYKYSVTIGVLLSLLYVQFERRRKLTIDYRKITGFSYSSY